jgi:hypothetical protein
LSWLSSAWRYWILDTGLVLRGKNLSEFSVYPARKAFYTLQCSALKPTANINIQHLDSADCQSVRIAMSIKAWAAPKPQKISGILPDNRLDQYKAELVTPGKRAPKPKFHKQYLLWNIIIKYHKTFKTSNNIFCVKKNCLRGHLKESNRSKKNRTTWRLNTINQYINVLYHTHTQETHTHNIYICILLCHIIYI